MKDTEHSHPEISHRSPFSVRIRLSPPFPGLQIETIILNMKSYPDRFLEVAGTALLLRFFSCHSALQLFGKDGARYRRHSF